MKAATRWLGCATCDVLRDHVRDASQLTPFGADGVADTWICTNCGARRLLAKPYSDQHDHDELKQRGQMRLID